MGSADSSLAPPLDISLAADQILIHYVKRDGVTALVVAEDTAGRRVPFSFLAELHRKVRSFASNVSPARELTHIHLPCPRAQFVAAYPMGEIAGAPAYGMNAFEPHISSLMTQYEDNPPQDAIKQAQAELAATKDVMVQSIDAVLSRGERIEILVDRTDDLSSQARAFRKRATVLRRKMWYRNAKTLFAVGFSAVVRPSSLSRFLSRPRLWLPR